MPECSNREIICQELLKAAGEDRDLVVLCSDSRGSASLAPFAERFPSQFVELGIAEQNLVSVAAGMALCGKRPFAASPACFLSSRALEQAKVDVAYSAANVKLIGISGGISYGALGMTHHSTQDIAAFTSLPGMRVFLPCDGHETQALMKLLLKDGSPAYLRVSRSPSRDVYESEPQDLTPGRMIEVRPGRDVTLIGCGETVAIAKDAAALLKESGIEARVLDSFCLKPFDGAAVQRAATETRGIVTIEEHQPQGGLGALCAQAAARRGGCPVRSIALPDAPLIAGSQREVFDYYGLTAQNLADTAARLVRG